MFRKTHLKLVLLNAAVFFLILNAFGGSLYWFLKQRLTYQVDTSLQDFAQHLQQEHYHDLMLPHPHGPDTNHRIEMVVWDTEGNVIRSDVDTSLVESDDYPKLNHSLSEDPVLLSTEHTGYRILRWKVPVDHVLLPDLLFASSAVQPGSELVVDLIYDMSPENNMLHHLLIIIGTGSVISLLLALVTGMFLANRALIPIQRAWEKQQQFVADASHELRTPLSVMKIQLERLFRHPDHSVEEESETISVLMHETKRMSKLVADLLTLARSDSNEIQLLTEPYSLNQVVDTVAKQFEPMAQIKHIVFHTEMPPQLQMMGDKERVHQLLVILLDNAFKYTPANGRIFMIGKRLGKHVEIQITDTGSGIAKEDLPHVFDRFFRSDKMRTRNIEGTGLGLSIAKWIVEAHAGSIRIDSELGKGTTVRVQLPIHIKV
jgi:two-component system sensor histidine kinase CiaH